MIDSVNKMSKKAEKRSIEMTDLLAYRLHKVANLVSHSAALRYRRDFDVSLWEWRTIALLGARGVMSLGELAQISGIDKGQISRVVSGLTARGIVQRDVDEVDARKVALSLTDAGMEAYRGLNQASNERNSEFLGCISDVEKQMLDAILDKIEQKARQIIGQERAVGSLSKN